jgi:hypothetical protein
MNPGRISTWRTALHKFARILHKNAKGVNHIALRRAARLHRVSDERLQEYEFIVASD